MRADWLADVLRDAGLDVYEMPGWQSRGHALADCHGVVVHHTATGPNWQDGHVAALLRDGRRDLAGPLAQLGLERDGTFVVVAAGRANHNGYGEWGNNSIGIEAYNAGTGEPWPAVQLDAFQRGAAAILKHLGKPNQNVKAHRETDPGRKPDPVGIDMPGFRTAVADILEGDDVTPQDKDEIVMRVVAALKPGIDKALNALAGYGTSPDGQRLDGMAAKPKTLSYQGRIGAALRTLVKPGSDADNLKR